MFKGLLCAALALSICAPLAPVAAASPLLKRFDERLESRRDALIEIRRDLHRHPEVSGQERRTAGVVAKHLRKLGFTVTTGVGGHGVVAILEGAKPGPRIAFRADMDAVPSAAPDPVPFKSVNAGVRHICGHDIHTTIGLALAEGFAAIRDELSGSLMLVFQPAEESATGARAMIADGVFDKDVPAAIFAYHTAPMNVGQMITAPGTLMAWRDRIQVTLRGKGDLPKTAQQIQAAIQALGTVPAAQAGAPASGDFRLVQVRSPTRRDGDFSVNAVISTATDSASDSARREIETLLAGLDVEGVDAELDYEKKWVAGVTNEAELTQRAVEVARGVLGESGVSITNVVIPTFSEDFGSFQQHVPGVMFFIGVSNPDKGWVGMPHSPGYVADEESIFVGARTMAAVLVDRMTAR